MRRVIAITNALWISLWNIPVLSIHVNEYKRYFLKSSNLALCYVGFSEKKNFKEALKAGEAAFLCCAYDVVTDWRMFDEKSFIVFKRILQSKVSEDLSNIAINLYYKELNNNLLCDGLERGVLAFQFVTRLMNTENYFKSITDTRKLGIFLQIIDDVLDYEDDIQRQELNCLSSKKKDYYLHILVDEFSDDNIKKLFPSERLLGYVIRQAKNKASTMLAMQ